MVCQISRISKLIVVWLNIIDSPKASLHLIVGGDLKIAPNSSAGQGLNRGGIHGSNVHVHITIAYTSSL